MEIPDFSAGTFPQHEVQTEFVLITPVGMETMPLDYILKTDLGEENPKALGYAMQALGIAIASSYIDGKNEG